MILIWRIKGKKSEHLSVLNWDPRFWLNKEARAVGSSFVSIWVEEGSMGVRRAKTGIYPSVIVI